LRSPAAAGLFPCAAIIGSQSAKADGPHVYDAGKKINGRKRHALVDTDGRRLIIEPHPASIQDRDGGGHLLRGSRAAFPLIQKVFADRGHTGERVATPSLIAVEIMRIRRFGGEGRSRTPQRPQRNLNL
jgi:Transposase DDE domain